mmetsp:Transcript_131561/g.366655  ORF Transcript_131561/g.366655 Transcript_131561/m.366655 type:complete len:319 (-) Transcript_131561:785-1741(-)
MSSSAMRLLRKSSTSSPPGRLARSTLAPASPMALFSRKSWVMLVVGRQDQAPPPKVMRLPVSTRSCRPTGRLAKSASAPASSIKLSSKNNLARKRHPGSLPANQAAPRLLMRLFLRLSCTKPSGNRVLSCKASNAMRFPISSSVCKPAGMPARSAWAPLSPIALLSKSRWTKLAGSRPASRAAPPSMMRFRWRARLFRFAGIWTSRFTSCGVGSNASGFSLRTSCCKSAGRYASTGPTPASVRPTSVRSSSLSGFFVASCSAKRSAALSPRGLWPSWKCSRSSISASASKYSAMRSSVQATRWRFWRLACLTTSKVSR